MSADSDLAMVVHAAGAPNSNAADLMGIVEIRGNGGREAHGQVRRQMQQLLLLPSPQSVQISSEICSQKKRNWYYLSGFPVNPPLGDLNSAKMSQHQIYLVQN